MGTKEAEILPKLSGIISLFPVLLGPQESSCLKANHRWGWSGIEKRPSNWPKQTGMAEWTSCCYGEKKKGKTPNVPK